MPRPKNFDRGGVRFTTTFHLGPSLGPQVYALSQQMGLPVTHVIRLLLESALAESLPEKDRSKTNLKKTREIA